MLRPLSESAGNIRNTVKQLIPGEETANTAAVGRNCSAGANLRDSRYGPWLFGGVADRFRFPFRFLFRDVVAYKAITGGFGVCVDGDGDVSSHCGDS